MSQSSWTGRHLIAVTGVISGTTYLNSVTPDIVIQDLNSRGTTDGTSGVDPRKTVITLDGQPFHNSTSVTAIGPHTLSASTADLAGNPAAATDSTGLASAELPLQPGLYTLAASFTGVPFYVSSNASSQRLYVYQPTQFVVWGGNTGGISVGQDYTFWGSQWDKQVIGGSYQANASFKGYASQVTGATWTTGPGNSSSPPSSVSNYIGVIVSTNLGKQGGTISGNVTELVVLRVDSPASYEPNPGHAGSGVMMAFVQ